MLIGSACVIHRAPKARNVDTLTTRAIRNTTCALVVGSGPENVERFLWFLFSGPFRGWLCVCAAGIREGALQTRPL